MSSKARIVKFATIDRPARRRNSTMIPLAESLCWLQIGFAVEIPQGSHASVVNAIALGVEIATQRRFIAERRGDRRYLARIK